MEKNLPPTMNKSYFCKHRSSDCTTIENAISND